MDKKRFGSYIFLTSDPHISLKYWFRLSLRYLRYVWVEKEFLILFHLSAELQTTKFLNLVFFVALPRATSLYRLYFFCSGEIRKGGKVKTLNPSSFCVLLLTAAKLMIWLCVKILEFFKLTGNYKTLGTNIL